MANTELISRYLYRDLIANRMSCSSNKYIKGRKLKFD